jgi:hypothetical protein
VAVHLGSVGVPKNGQNPLIFLIGFLSRIKVIKSINFRLLDPVFKGSKSRQQFMADFDAPDFSHFQGLLVDRNG